MSALTQQRLKEVLDYDPHTGHFVWRTAVNSRALAGSAAGTRNTPYVSIGIDGVRYYAQRLAWMYVHGVMPRGEIDHINEVKRDNRITNLRDTDSAGNKANQKNARRDNDSGLRGVSLNKRTGLWCAYIQVRGARKNLGYFHEAVDAHAAYLNAKGILCVG